MKFELLFDLGVYAIVDGYYREAVSSFTAALERFYEFFIETQCDRLGVDQATFETAWKNVSNQSERQLGAFVFMHLTEMKAPPKILTSDEVKFRNGVIHKGKFPTRAETIDYGNRVGKLIIDTLNELRSRDAAAITRAILRHLKRISVPAAGSNLATMAAGTMISLSRAASEPQPTLADWIKMLEMQKSALSLEAIPVDFQ